MYNSNLPLAGSTFVEAMKATETESLLCVLYALKLVAETSDGIEALKSCKLVLYGGKQLSRRPWRPLGQEWHVLGCLL